MADLIVQDAYHVGYADEVGVVGGVHTLSAIQEAAHVHVADLCEPSKSWHGTTLQDDGKSYPRLPALWLSAQAGERINASATLPGLQLTDARAGTRMTSAPNLPDLSCSATMISGATASMSKRLPTVSLSSRTGARSGDLTLPAMELSISITGDRTGRLDKTLPGLTIEAEGSTPVLCTLDKDLPALSISAEASTISTAILAKDLPALKISAASALAGATATLDATLPSIGLDSDNGLYGDSLSLDANLPAIVAAIAAGSIPGSIGSISSESRYTDYVLRYVR